MGQCKDREGRALIDKAIRHRRRGPYQIQAAIAALHVGARHPEDADWAQIDALYAALEELRPSPVVTHNRAVAVAKVRGPEAALTMIEPLGDRLSGYFYFHGLRGALLVKVGGRRTRAPPSAAPLRSPNSPAEAAHIRMHLDRLMADSVAAWWREIDFGSSFVGGPPGRSS